MGRGWMFRAGLIVLVTVASLWYLVPTSYYFRLPREARNDPAKLEQVLPQWAPSASRRLNLGLDLQGGINLVLRVDTKTALQKRAERRGLQMVTFARDQKLGELKVDTEAQRLLVKLTAQDAANLDAVQREVVNTFDDFSFVGREGNSLVLSLNDRQATRFREEAVEQAMLVIRRRIDRWGVAEVDVRKLGSDAIQISLPGQSDPEQAKELIGTTAQLEFRLVDDTQPFFQEIHQASAPPVDSGIRLVNPEGFWQLEAQSREPLLAYLEGKAPAERQFLLECVEGAKKGTCLSYRTYLVDKRAPLTGESLESADASLGQNGMPEVNLSFDAAGAREFARLTEENSGKRMAIVLDENVHSAPRINERIPNGRARITLGGLGDRTHDEILADAQTLALVLKAGALPAPVSIGEIRQVGASLGDELIRRGTMAALVGLLLVLVFMAIYYRLSGVIADVALVLNGLLILAGLALFNATLTMPGIAGFVLTLGIAVDANVLINERIREELRSGKTARSAVDHGYDRAFWTIFDAHVTTLIAGGILLYFGTGPVRGFATSLIIGLLASLFTSIVVTRVITTYWVHGRNAQTVSV
ncbi:MAG: protein translocase subunit SecD [Myxococcaceae bacterium]